MTTMTDLRRGDRGVVRGFERGSNPYRSKLLAMGVTPRTEFTIVRYAPMGDPIEVELRGYRLSLRRAEAAVVKADLVEQAPRVSA